MANKRAHDPGPIAVSLAQRSTSAASSPSACLSPGGPRGGECRHGSSGVGGPEQLPCRRSARASGAGLRRKRSPSCFVGRAIFGGSVARGRRRWYRKECRIACACGSEGLDTARTDIGARDRGAGEVKPVPFPRRQSARCANTPDEEEGDHAGAPVRWTSVDRPSLD